MSRVVRGFLTPYKFSKMSQILSIRKVPKSPLQPNRRNQKCKSQTCLVTQHKSPKNPLSKVRLPKTQKPLLTRDYFVFLNRVILRKNMFSENRLLAPQIRPNRGVWYRDLVPEKCPKTEINRCKMRNVYRRVLRM